MAAGSIVIDLICRTGTFSTDTERAGKSLKQFQKDADAAGRSAEASGRAIGLAFGAAVVTVGTSMLLLAKNSLSSVDAFNDLKDATGASVENISAIDRVARETGVSFGTVEAVLVNLNKALNAAEPDSKVARALTAIGLSAADLKKLDPAEAVFKVATALRGFADDGSKARAIQDIFNKSAKEAAPLLVDLAQKGELVASTTTDQAQAVEDYRKKSFALKADIEDLARTFTVSLIPVLIDATAKIKELFGGAARSQTISTEIRNLGDELGKLKGMEGKGFTLSGFFGTEAQRKERIAKVEGELMDAQKRYQGIFTNSSAGAGRGSGYGDFRSSVGDIPDKNKKTHGPKDDPTKKELDNQLRAFQKDIDRERELFQTRNDFIELYNSQNLLSLRDYYSARKVALDEATAGEIAGIDKQIRELEAHQRAPKTTKVQAADDEGKLIDLRDKRAKVEQDADRQALLMSERQRFAAEELAKQFQSVNAQVLDLQENFTAAAAIKFDQQFDSISATFKKENNVEGQKFVATLRAAAISQAAIQKASTESARALGFEQVQEDKLAAAFESGQITTLELLSKEGAARKALIPAYEAQVAALQAIFTASGRSDDLLRLEQAKVALDKLKASADPLAASLNKTFGDDFNGALDDFVTGTKSAADAFKSFSKSVLNDILKLGSKSITESIFGGSGGIGGAISQFFGKNSGAAGAVSGVSDATGTAARTAETAAVSASTAALSAFTASSSASTAALTAEAAALGAADIGLTGLAASASAAAAALTAVAATSAASSGSSLLGFASVAGISGGRADGGPVGAGQSFVVGERGIEVLHMGAQSGTVTPNHMLGGKTVNNYISVSAPAQPGVSRDSAMQQGAAIGLGIQRALARNS